MSGKSEDKKMGKRQGFGAVLDWLYPRRCALCGKLLPVNRTEFLCDACQVEIPFLTGLRCPRCGAPLGRNEAVYCRRCRNTSADDFSWGFAAFAYPRVQQGIRLFKYDRVRGQGEPLATLMFLYLLREHPHVVEGIDIVTAVPLSKARLRWRGFNQSDLLAEGLCRRTGLPYRQLLVRLRDTLPQAGLNPRERRENLKNAFGLAPGADCRGKRVLLVDDVFTTGATVNACAQVLREAGVTATLFYTLSIATGK